VKPPPARGLTLLELLLTVVIFSLVIGIFSQALFQISQFARASASTAGLWQQRWLSGYALDEVFVAMTLPTAAGDPGASGDSTTFSTWWTEGAGAQAGRPIRVQLRLRPLNAQAGPTAWGLFVDDGNSNESLRARWDFPVGFRYGDAAGGTASAWPPRREAADIRDEALPRTLWVVDETGAIAHAWTYLGLTQSALMPRRDPFIPGSGQPRP